jgi:hypothetical protein
MRICIPNQNLPKNTPLGPVSDQVAKFQQLAIVFPAAAQILRLATFPISLRLRMVIIHLPSAVLRYLHKIFSFFFVIESTIDHG